MINFYAWISKTNIFFITSNNNMNLFISYTTWKDDEDIAYI